MTTLKSRGLRKRIWEQGKDPSPRDIAESLRDVDRQLVEAVPLRILKCRTLYSPPLYLECDHAPDAVLCVRTRLAFDPATVASSLAPCVFDYTGEQIKVISVPLLVLERIYDFTFLIIG